MDGFDEDESESQGDDGAVVLGRLLAAERHALEALELAYGLLDASAAPVEGAREELWPVASIALDGGPVANPDVSRRKRRSSLVFMLC